MVEPQLDELRRSEERLQAVIESSPLAIMELDLEARVIRWNPAAERIFGWAREEMIGRTDLPMVPGSKREESEHLEATIRAGQPYSDYETVRQRGIESFAPTGGFDAAYAVPCRSLDQAREVARIETVAKYRPMMTDERAERIRAWHDAHYQSEERTKDLSLTYLGRTFVVPHLVHPPARMSELLGRAVLAEVRESDRVLDMGTGSGANAVLAASKSSDVVAVDVNPFAVACAKHNAELNGVAARIDVFQSDVFENVEGRFDLIVFDPPFRWFAPRDIRERGTADENYETLTTFFSEVNEYLKDDGRVLVFFGTSGDLDYLRHLIAKSRFTAQEVDTRQIVKDDWHVTYYTFKLTAG